MNKSNELATAIEWGASQICGDFDFQAELDRQGSRVALHVVVTRKGAGKMLMHTPSTQHLKGALDAFEDYWQELDADEFPVIINQDEGPVYGDEAPHGTDLFAVIDDGLTRYFHNYIVDIDAGIATLERSLEGPGQVVVWEKAIGSITATITVDTDDMATIADEMSGDPESDCSQLLMLAHTPATRFQILCEIKREGEQIGSFSLGGCMVLVEAYSREFSRTVVKDYGRELLGEAIAEARRKCPKGAKQKEEVEA